MNNEDLTRIEKFRQLKSAIRGSKEHLIVGIDVAKEKHYAFMGTSTGKILLRRLIFDNNINGFSKLLTHTGAIKTQNGLSKVVFGLEPTGNYHKPLGMHLIRCAYDVVMVSGVAVKRNRELLDGRWDKHDTKCAANIADLISQGKCLYYESPISEINEIRELLSLRKRFKKEEHRLKMRIRNNLVAKYFPEFDKFIGQCKGENLGIVKWCLDPSRIAGMEFIDFFNTVTTNQRGFAMKKRLRKIHELAVYSIGCPMTVAAEFEAKVLVDELKQVRKLLKEIETMIDQTARLLEEYHCLLTIPGFGPYVSALVLATIGVPNRFENRSQVLKMAGFDLNASRSGKSSNKAIPVISKRGSCDLRYALCQAAMVASSRNIYFVRYFTEKVSGREKERGIKLKMRVKLAAKLLIIAWTLMKERSDFDPSFIKLNQE